VRALAGSGERWPAVSSVIVLGALCVLAFTVLTGVRVREVALLVALVATAAVAYRSLLRWHSLVTALLLVVLFVPIKRYGLPADLPFELEPYRLVVAVIAAAWLASLLVDPRVRLRPTGLEAPIILFIFAALASVIVNASRIKSIGVDAEVAKSLSFFASFFVIVYLIVSVIRSQDRINLLVKVLTLGGAVVAGFAVIESRTGYNVFNHLSGVVPLLRFDDPAREFGLSGDYLSRSGRLRVFASAQHPIALAAALVMLMPLAVYLARTSARRWWIAAALLGLGAMATVSRTGILMLVVVCFVFLWLKSVETKRMWPALLPLLLIVYFALPNTLGSLYAAFFPQGGLLAEQQAVVEQNPLGADGRIADIGPSLQEFIHQPLLGQGFGSRVTFRLTAEEGGSQQFARILDNQWLGTLLEMGLAGAVALLWLLARMIRQLAARAKADTSAESWLAAALAASIYAFAVGMLTFDAFSFVQVTLLFFVLLGLGAAMLAGRRPEPAPEPARLATV
jgi:polysaccharide biosynthesis protein PslJ